MDELAQKLMESYFDQRRLLSKTLTPIKDPQLQNPQIEFSLPFCRVHPNTHTTQCNLTHICKWIKISNGWSIAWTPHSIPTIKFEISPKLLSTKHRFSLVIQTLLFIIQHSIDYTVSWLGWIYHDFFISHILGLITNLVVVLRDWPMKYVCCWFIR